MPESAQKLLHELTAAGLLSSAEITKFDREVTVGVEALLDRLVADSRITQYQAAKFLAGQSSDIYFGDYVVLEELGRGGMGTVLLAKHRRMDREVAIKILPVTTLDSAPAVARFYQEVKVAAQLTHPNIVHAYDAGEHHGFHYLVMEYVRGHDLAKVLDQLGFIPALLALDYTTQVAQGLDYAHRKGVVHRDIKPSNLLLDNEGTVKVLDLGLARIGRGAGIGTDVSLHLTTTGQVMGTVEYMSPEQAEDTRDADARSDIYSLGCTFFRLVTGKSPFARDTVVKTILAHREAPVPSRELEQDPALVLTIPLFQKMVAKNPADRFQNMSQLLVELRRISELISQSEQSVSTLRETHRTNPPLSDQSPTIAPRYYVAPNVPGFTAPGEVTIEHSSKPSLRDGGQAYSRPENLGSPSPKMSYQTSQSTEIVDAMPLTSDGRSYGAQNFNFQGVKPHRGGTIMAMGIFSLMLTGCGVGAILGLITWVYAHNDLSEMKQGLRNADGMNMTRVGKIMGMVSVGIVALATVAGIIGSAF